MPYRLPHVGAKFKAARLDKEMTLEQVARKVGISKSHLHYIEKGKIAPSILVAYDLSRALKINLNKIMQNDAK